MMTASALALLVPLTALAALLGRWHAPLPRPALQGQRVAELGAEDSAIWGATGLPLQGALEPNDVLQHRAVRLFADKLQGAETVAHGPGPDSVTMVDAHGYVWVADAPHGGADAQGGGSKQGTGASAASDVQLGEAANHRETSAEHGKEPGTGQGGRTAQYVLRSQPYAYVGPGRVLGLRYDGDGNLLLCDCVKGLLMLEGAALAAQAQGRPVAARSTRLVVLANSVSLSSPLDPGSLVTYADDLDVAPDGRVYFSDAQDIPTTFGSQGVYDPMQSATLGLMSGTPSGRLLCYDPSDGTTRVLAKGLWFSNGVAVSPRGSFVAVAETNRLRVLRYWLQGPKAGTTDMLIEHLPGFPDGVSRASDGNFWIAILAPQLSVQPYLRSRVVRTILAWLPHFLRPAIDRQGLVLRVSPEGQVLGSFWDVTGSNVALATSAEEHDGRLWLGQLGGAGVWSLPLHN